VLQAELLMGSLKISKNLNAKSVYGGRRHGRVRRANASRRSVALVA